MTTMPDAAPHTSGAAPAITITAYGIPGPQGSKAYKGHRVSRATGRRVAVLVESSKKVKPWREEVEAAAIAATAAINGWQKLDGPLVAEVFFTLPKPTSAPKRRRTWPTKYPDLSKLLRSTEDALTTAGVWADDARVIGYRRLWKFFPNEGPEALTAPGAVIHIWRYTDEHAA